MMRTVKIEGLLMAGPKRHPGNLDMQRAPLLAALGPGFIETEPVRVVQVSKRYYNAHAYVDVTMSVVFEPPLMDGKFPDGVHPLVKQPRIVASVPTILPSGAPPCVPRKCPRTVPNDCSSLPEHRY